MSNIDLNGKSLADLRYIAQIMGLSISDSISKDDLISLISGGTVTSDKVQLGSSNGSTETDSNKDIDILEYSDEPAKKKTRGRPKKASPRQELIEKDAPTSFSHFDETELSSMDIDTAIKPEFIGEEFAFPMDYYADSQTNTASEINDTENKNVSKSHHKRGRRKHSSADTNQNKAEDLNSDAETSESTVIPSTQETDADSSSPSPIEFVDSEDNSESTSKEAVSNSNQNDDSLKLIPSSDVNPDTAEAPVTRSKRRSKTVSKSQKHAETVPETKSDADIKISNEDETAPVQTASYNSEGSYILKTGARKNVPEPTEEDLKEQEDKYDIFEGMLDVLSDGYGFLRSSGFLSGSHDIYVAPATIKKYSLRTGDMVKGKCKMQKESEKFQALYEILSVNGDSLEDSMKRKPFDSLIPIYPDEKLRLEIAPREFSTRIIDLFAPIGKGQRGIIVSPPKAGKTVLLKKIANSITANYPEMELIVLLIDERPEEVTDMRESIKGTVVSSTFDEVPEKHIKVSEMVIERAQRLVEQGKDVVILMDSMTRLARAYNLTIPPTGRTLSGGLDPGALHKPKRFFGSARNIRDGGSLTIISTALIDTGSKMDEVIYEEFKGTGNMELHLDRKLSEKRIFPAIDIVKSGTRKEELLLSETEIDSIWAIRKAMSNLGTADVTEMIINKLMQTRCNTDFVRSINTQFGGKK